MTAGAFIDSAITEVIPSSKIEGILRNTASLQQCCTATLCTCVLPLRPLHGIVYVAPRAASNKSYLYS